MFKLGGVIRYEVGDSIPQDNYDAAGDATVIEVEPKGTRAGTYWAEIILPEGHDDAFDENGEPEYVKRFYVFLPPNRDGTWD